MPERIRYYMDWMGRNAYQCPRAIALYLNGAVSLLLDGHHKAAAAAALGNSLRTLVIFPLQEERNVEAAIRKGAKLELYHGRWNVLEDRPDRWGYHPLHLMDGDKAELSKVRNLTKYAVKNETFPRREAPEWGSVPEEFCAKLKDYPSGRELSHGTYIPPDRIKEKMKWLRQTPCPLPGEPWEEKNTDAYPWFWDWLQMLKYLHAFSHLFPDSSLLTEDQCRWLDKTCTEARRVVK